MDIYCLNADGALLDTALLAAAGALLRLRLPAIAVNKKGRVAVRAGGIDGGADGGAEAAAEGGVEEREDLHQRVPRHRALPPGACVRAR